MSAILPPLAHTDGAVELGLMRNKQKSKSRLWREKIKKYEFDRDFVAKRLAEIFLEQVNANQQEKVQKKF